MSVAADALKAEVKQAAPAKPAAPAQKDLDELFKSECFKNTASLIEKTKAYNNDVLRDAVKAYLELLSQQLAVFECMCVCAKPAKFDMLTTLAKTTKKFVFDLGKKDRKIGIHLRTIEDSTDLFCWFSLPNEKKEFMEGLNELAGGMDFQGQKLCDKAQDKEWYRALRVVQQDFATFLKNNFPRCMKWEGDMEDLESFLEGSLAGIKANPLVTMTGGGTTTAPAPVSAPAPVPAKPAAGQQAPVAKPKPAVKEPQRIKKGKAIEFYDFKNVKEVIELGEGDIDSGSSINFFDC